VQQQERESMTPNSRLSASLRLGKYSPVAVILTDQKPDKALQFKQGRWGCVAAMIVAAAKGRTAVFDRETYGCAGGGIGLGFGDPYREYPIEELLSTGDGGAHRAWTRGSHLAEGERYFKTPEIARKFVEALPIREVPTKYVVLKPFAQVAEGETPSLVMFLANADQLSALLILSNYHRAIKEGAIAPFGAGCHSILYGFAEAERDHPRAVIGFTDITVRKLVERDILSLTVPWELYLEMEKNVEGSFIEKDQWLNVAGRV